MASSSTSSNQSLPNLIDDLQASGRYTLSLGEVLERLGVSEIAAANAIRRLREKGRLVSPRRGFYVIVPIEYRSAGSPPPSWFIDELMRFTGQPYYVGLLSAAALHGASHQQAMAFQVVTDRPTRSAMAGRVRVEFHTSRLVERAPITQIQTETGSMRVSTPELTALDVVRFVDACGGWDNVATVLTEMGASLEGGRLAGVAEGAKAPDLQRLGYLLDRAGHGRAADSLLRVLSSHRWRPVLLSPGYPAGEAVPVAPWRVVDNVGLDADL